MLRFRPLSFALLLVLAACGAPETPPVLPSPTASAVPTHTAEPSPSPSPIPPTPTLGPGPREFTEQFDAPAPRWDLVSVSPQDAPVSPRFSGGSLVLEMPMTNQWLLALYDSQQYSDVRIDAKVEVRGGERAAPGVVCRYDENKGWYEFDIHDDATYVVLYGEWLRPGLARYTPIAEADTEYIRPGENEISLLCEGDVLTPFVNGKQLRRRQETKYKLTRGRVGVAAASFDDVPAVISLDAVTVSIP